MEEAIADIAFVFHWPPSEMMGWDAFELAAWWARARARASRKPPTDE